VSKTGSKLGQGSQGANGRRSRARRDHGAARVEATARSLRCRSKTLGQPYRRTHSLTTACLRDSSALAQLIELPPFRSSRPVVHRRFCPAVDPRRQLVSIHGRSPVISVDSYVAPSATLIGQVRAPRCWPTGALRACCLSPLPLQVEIADKAGIWYNTVLRGECSPPPPPSSLSPVFEALSIVSCVVIRRHEPDFSGVQLPH